MKTRSLEDELHTHDWLLQKIRIDRIYAQNFYAALCNNEFIPNELFELIKQENIWSCSWRYAGGLVAEIRENEDYLDWYCSGMHALDGYQPESCVTEEVEQDLLRMGWKVIKDSAKFY